MKALTLAIALLALPISASAQTLSQIADQLDALSKAIRAQIPPPPVPQTVTVSTNAELQAALLKGGAIAATPGAHFTGAFVVSVPGTTLTGSGASIAATGAPAISVTASNVALSDLTLTSTGDPVFLCGRNDSGQTSLAQVPVNVTVALVTVPTHRGKRAFEWNCSGTLDHDVALDTWDPNGQDSQGLAILNSPGDTKVTGGKYQAGSECLLIGGDTMKIPGVVPTNITIDGVELSRPLSWKTDGVVRKVKNLLELKTGRTVRISNLALDGSWKDAQEGWAIVLTPHSGGDIQDVVIDHVNAQHVGAAVQLLGREYAGIPTLKAMSGIVIQNSRFQVDSKTYGGRGVFVLATGEPGSFTATNNVVVSDGTSVVYYDPGTVLDPVTGLSRPGGPWQSVTLTGNYLVPGIYGLVFAGLPNAAPNVNGVTSLTVTGNTFADAASALMRNVPQNTFLSRADWDVAVAALVKQ